MTDLPPNGSGESGAPGYTSPTDDDTATEWSNARVAAFLFALVALLGGTFLAVSVATGGGDGPETAIEELFEAIGNEDVIGVLASLDPEERQAIEPGLRDITEELKRIGVLADDFALDGIDGIDLEFSDLQTETTTITDDLVAVTVVGGTVRTSTDPAAAPVGAAFADEIAGAESTEEVETLDPDDAFTLVAIRRDGWHVSIGYSILYNVTVEEGLDFPDPAAGLTPDGADTPKGAVEEMLAAGADLDAARVLALLAPGEMDALHTAAPLFIDEIQTEINSSVPEGTTVEITDLQLAEQDVDGGKRILLESYGVDIAVPGEGSFGFTFDGECTTIRGTPSGAFADATEIFGGQEKVCADDVDQLLGPLADLFNPIGQAGGIIVVEKDGQWYVSPVRTTLDLVVQFLKAIPDDGFQDLMEGFFGGFLGMSGESQQSELFAEEYTSVEPEVDYGTEQYPARPEPGAFPVPDQPMYPGFEEQAEAVPPRSGA